MTGQPTGNGEDDPCSGSFPKPQALAPEVLSLMVDKRVLTKLSENGPLRVSRLLEGVGGSSQSHAA